ncbi:MAG: hypothetical protein WDZ28_04205 [Simkaniaceae bacterium]
MGTPSPPIRPSDSRDSEKVTFPSIERQKRIKEKYEDAKEEQEGGFFLLTWVMQTLKKVINIFITSREEGYLNPEIQTLFVDIRKLRNLFARMKTEDMSHDATFISRLSIHWSVLATDIENLGFEHVTITLKAQLAHLKSSLNDYSIQGSMSFGFYLEEHAGESWFPLPFLEMIRSLYTEALITPEYCTLSSWIKEIDTILQG